MNDFKLKIILAILSSIVFAFVFILLAFMLPTKEDDVMQAKKHEKILEETSKSVQK